MARARALLAAGALFRDGQGRVLLVEPSYKEVWEIPGGVVDAGETPYAACEREIGEELGLSRRPGRLLVVDHCRRPHVQWEGIRFVFEGGLLAVDEVKAIQLRTDELIGWRFVDVAAAAEIVAPPLFRRLEAAAGIDPSSPALYLEDGIPVA
jgi:ADP-ribose pyrophosphatase YjhB (NUDIX family)